MPSSSVHAKFVIDQSFFIVEMLLPSMRATNGHHHAQVVASITEVTELGSACSCTDGLSSILCCARRCPLHSCAVNNIEKLTVPSESNWREVRRGIEFLDSSFGELS